MFRTHLNLNRKRVFLPPSYISKYRAAIAFPVTSEEKRNSFSQEARGDSGCIRGTRVLGVACSSPISFPEPEERLQPGLVLPMWAGQRRGSSAALGLPSGLVPTRFHPTLSCRTFLFPQRPQRSRLRAFCCELPAPLPPSRWARSVLGSCSPTVTGPCAQLASRDTPHLLSSGSPVATVFPRPKRRPSLASLRPLSLRNRRLCHLLLGHRESESKREAQVCSSGLTPPLPVLLVLFEKSVFGFIVFSLELQIIWKVRRCKNS